MRVKNMWVKIPDLRRKVKIIFYSSMEKNNFSANFLGWNFPICCEHDIIVEIYATIFIFPSSSFSWFQFFPVPVFTGNFPGGYGWKDLENMRAVPPVSGFLSNSSNDFFGSSSKSYWSLCGEGRLFLSPLIVRCR